MSCDSISTVSQISNSAVSAGLMNGIVVAFSRLVARDASRTLVVAPGQRATVGQVNDLSHAAGEHVLNAHLEPSQLVAFAAPNGPTFLAGFLALLRAGHVVLLVDPLAPPEDRRRVSASLGAAAVFECSDPWPSSSSAFRLTTLGARANVHSLHGVDVVKITSGSTGAPRGVAMSADHLLADEAALREAMGLTDEDRLLGAIPLSHSYGFTTLVLSALVRGSTLVIPAERGPFSPLAAARELGATVFPTVPAYIQALLNLSPPPAWPSSIRLVISAGAFLSSGTATRFRQTYGQPVHSFYGSSECGGICYDREGGAAERGTVGTPVEGARVSVVPLENGAEEGLVVVESPAVGEKYLPTPDKRLHAGRFETADVGTWSGGEIALLRRVDRVINVRGRKVDPSEVETVLAGLNGVAEVVVIGMASPNGKDEIVRAVVACPSNRPDVRDLTAWCRHRLADHKVPRSIVFVDAIPRTPRGKVDRAALLKLNGSNNDLDMAHE